MTRLRVALAFLAAVILMATTGTIAQTQFVLSALALIGAPVSLADRLAMTLADLAGFAPLYAAVIAIGFLIAFSAAGLLQRRFVALPKIAVFAVAGAVCVAVMLIAMREVFFGIPLIAGARSTAGFLTQIACGAFAGAIFGALMSRTGRAGTNGIVEGH